MAYRTPQYVNYTGNTVHGHARAHLGTHYGNNITNHFGSQGGTQARMIPNRGGEAKHPRQNKYTVGWICALPVPEWQASRLLFDRRHEDVSLPQTTYQYVFGEMNGHNVVMGCLPASQLGKTAAASVAKEMQMTFPNLRFSLMVGVAGGVWSKNNDVRLGDVVVSQPDLKHKYGGVLQYDFGKAIGGGDFLETGSLNAPPEILLSALSKFQSASPSEIMFHQYLETFEKYADEGPKFAAYAERPYVPDRLFLSSYTHIEGQPDCDECDAEQEVKRRPRRNDKPVIHFGTIASADQVMKDAKKRDQLSQGRDILCFEMEAAGLMNRFPCLVVRGICDYCDSHKNKAWQPYAAAVAAALAKELLRNVSASTPSSGEQSESTG